MILFVNACVREESRTKRIADGFLSTLEGDIAEVELISADIPKTSEAFLNMREKCVRDRDFSSPAFQFAREFADADEIVIAAPLWDLSFPAILKQYLEQVTVPGITFKYTSEGRPQGLCRAKRLTYITTSGGPITNDEYGYGYVRALAEGFYGIPEVQQIKAEGLDIDGADVEGIILDAVNTFM